MPRMFVTSLKLFGGDRPALQGNAHDNPPYCGYAALLIPLTLTLSLYRSQAS